MNIEDNSKGQSANPQNTGSNVTPPGVEKYLKGISFPADKNDLLRQIRANNAPKEVVDAVEQLEEKTYHSPIDISQQMGES